MQGVPVGHAGQLGGAVFQDAGNFEIAGTYFVGSVAQNQGGAIYQSNCTGSIMQSTFTGNSAANGGAVYQLLGRGELGAAVELNGVPS